MASKKYVLVAIIVCILSTISLGLFLAWTNDDDEETTPAPPLPPPPPPPLPTTTPEPEEDDDDTNQDILPLVYGGVTVLHPRVPTLHLADHPIYETRHYIVPGASLPFLKGKKLDQATILITTTYPNISVKAVAQGLNPGYEFRRDRVVLLYDSYTKYVIDARIG